MRIAAGLLRSISRRGLHEHFAVVASGASEEVRSGGGVGERSYWQVAVRSLFFFLPFLSTHFPSRLLLARYVHKGNGLVEREEGKAHIAVNLQPRVRSPQLDAYSSTDVDAWHTHVLPCVLVHLLLLRI